MLRKVELIMYKTIVWIFIIFIFTTKVYADVEWGGGNVRFYSYDKELLTNYNGLASLVAVRQGKLINLNNSKLEESNIWVTPGSIITDEENINVVVSVSWAFDDGLLWMSGSPYVSTSDMISYGLLPGDKFYLIVWDRNTFNWNHPVEGTTYTIDNMYIDGDITKPATSYGDDDFGDMIRPEKKQTTAVCDQYFLKTKCDINNDERITIKDLIIFLQIFSNIDVQIQNDIKYIDINNNNRIDYVELFYLLKLIFVY